MRLGTTIASTRISLYIYIYTRFQRKRHIRRMGRGWVENKPFTRSGVASTPKGCNNFGLNFNWALSLSFSMLRHHGRSRSGDWCTCTSHTHTHTTIYIPAIIIIYYIIYTRNMCNYTHTICIIYNNTQTRLVAFYIIHSYHRSILASVQCMYALVLLRLHLSSRIILSFVWTRRLLS